MKTDCWEWQNAKSSAGYGQVRLDRVLYYVHRLMYQQEHGEIPKGYQIDHLCRNRACCNPAHLEAVTQKENIHRGNGWSGIKARTTHCPSGHELTGDNLVAYELKLGKRKCRECKVNRDRAYYHRKAIAV